MPENVNPSTTVRAWRRKRGPMVDVVTVDPAYVPMMLRAEQCGDFWTVAEHGRGSWWMRWEVFHGSDLVRTF